MVEKPFNSVVNALIGKQTQEPFKFKSKPNDFTYMGGK